MNYQHSKPFQLLGSAITLPKKLVHSDEIDNLMGFAQGTTYRQSGVRQRHYVIDENNISLAADAASKALSQANLTLDAVDCIIHASGSQTDSVPSQAKHVFHALAGSKPLVTFDVNHSCLSFMHALSVAIDLLHEQSHQCILITGSDVMSKQINWKNMATGGLFGDGAAAVVIAKANWQSNKPSQKLLCYQIESQAERFCQFKPDDCTSHDKCCMQYSHDELSHLTSVVLPDFIQGLFDQVQLSMAVMDWVVPHQSSKPTLSHLQHRLQIPLGKMVNIIENVGNQVSASIPTALHILLNSQRIHRHDKVLLLGAGAGMNVAGMVLEM